MKVSAFQLMPHRELPDDFEQRYRSVWVDPPWWELSDPERVGEYYNWTLDELLYGAKLGLDGLCTNEHHQNAYGFMPNPNLMGAILAKATRDQGLDVAIVQMGSTLATTQPPHRIAEEYAMLDCISGGRLVAGVPMGTSMDVEICYGVPPLEHRERFREALQLIIRAWTTNEVFAWNGKFWQLPAVDVWPRPVQKPYPPIWLPGAGSRTTWRFAAENDLCYCFLSYFGARAAEPVANAYWEDLQELGKDLNPYRFGYLQLVTVSETDARAEEEYARHIEYFYRKCLHIPTEWFAIPGYQDYESLVYALRRGGLRFEELKELRYKDFVDQEFVISGSPATVRDRLEDVIKRLRVGNLMVLLQIGSMPHELTLKNYELFAREVLPHLRGIWEGRWENHWWPKKLLKQPAAT
jgi:alkanesulfonate monooxygenase SsuD/methylene tetrahydromethanopterin reductase-like flavin-dependent oxidoreductase (luciferase family)